MIFDYIDHPNFVPVEMTWDVADNTLMFGPSPTGAQQTLDQLGERWMLQLTYSARTQLQRGQLGAFWIKLGGKAHRVRLWPLDRPMPLGTLRGSPTLAAPASQMATSVLLQGCSPADATLMEGDWLGIGGQLLMVTDFAQASAGMMLVKFRAPLRRSMPVNQAVIWYRPTAIFMRDEGSIQLITRPRSFPGFSVALREDF